MVTVSMRHGGTAVAQLPQDVDYDSVPHIVDQCEHLIRQGCTTLVLDASQVQYLDSSGISMIITLANALVAQTGTLRLAGLNAHYQQVWGRLGLDTLLPVTRTVSAALSPQSAGQPSSSAARTNRP
ncbi:STAS domain-containing protein [Streptomyces sp. NPDC053367]|uniref:STAS domain-containing protein n=1 Tax=Streptomyces sp. NPDC053367 TaxID=3365700 RepID=UPI0037D90980